MRRCYRLSSPTYLDCVSDLLDHPQVRSMKDYMQHGDISCLEHCLYVSYHGYIICRRLGLDCRSAARGGLLHDFFLYDWHGGKRPFKGLHGPKHPRVALQNANHYFSLNPIEKDIIGKHMWPLTFWPPRYLETLLLIIIDKQCALLETFHLRKRDRTGRLKSLLAYACKSSSA